MIKRMLKRACAVIMANRATSIVIAELIIFLALAAAICHKEYGSDLRAFKAYVEHNVINK